MSLKGKAQKYNLTGNVASLKEIHGYSAYELAVINGFDGSVVEWLEYLRNGDKGDKGDKGDSVHVRYSASADGTNFTATYSEGQGYIGVAVASVAPTTKESYEWLPLSSNVSKLDKVTSSGGLRVYAVAGSGAQIMIGAFAGVSTGSLVYRDGSGNASISTPTGDSHIANKKYVDDAITAVITNVLEESY